MTTDRDNDFEARLQSALRDSTEHVDAETRQQLGGIRRRAVEAAAGRDRQNSGWLWAGGLVTACLLLLMVNLHQPPPAAVSPELLENLDVLMTEEPLNLYEEMEFYQWLENEDQTG